MMTRCNTLRFALAIASGLAVCSAASASDPAVLYGAKSAQFAWAPAPGDVAGYYVIVSRNGSGLELAGFATGTSASVTGKYGDSITVQVAAYDSSGAAGPLSPPSQTIVFSPRGAANGSGSGGSDGGTGDPAPSTPPAPASLDFTGDGVPDLIVHDVQTGSVSLWQLAGSVVTAVIELPNVAGDWQVVGNGDYDGNGVADILWQNDASGALELWNMANAAVGATVNYALEGLESDGHWFVVGSGDFDGDSRDDIVLLNRVVGVIEIMRQDASGAITSWARFESYRGAWTVSATPDLDGDGIAEIVWSDMLEDRAVVWHVLGVDSAEATLLAETLAGWRLAGSGDFDGDGRADLLLRGTATADAKLWLMADATITATLAVPANAAAADALVSGGADFDTDGRSDLLGVDATAGTITLWLPTASGFAQQAVVGAALTPGSELAIADSADDSEFRRKLCSADLDGDGMVGTSDFVSFGKCYGQTSAGACEIADLDSDGLVGDTDYALLIKNFGQPACANGY